jgi:AmiR/NasT family two-component response regulator
VIEQAKGVLMAKQGFSAQEAFDEVSRRSQEQNRTARDTAAEIVRGLDAGQRSDAGTEACASANP